MCILELVFIVTEGAFKDIYLIFSFFAYFLYILFVLVMDSLEVKGFSLFDVESVKRYRLAFVFGLGMVFIATQDVFLVRVALWQHTLKSTNFLLNTPELLQLCLSSEHFVDLIMNVTEIDKSFFLIPCEMHQT